MCYKAGCLAYARILLWNSLFVRFQLSNIVLLSFSIIIFSCDSVEVEVEGELARTSSRIDSPFESPIWSGKHAVGVRDFWLEDESRDETLAKEVGGKRSIFIRVHFPAVLDESLPKFKVVNDFEKEQFAFRLGGVSPDIAYRNFDNAFWNVYLNAEIDNRLDAYPLLVYSHGHGAHALWQEIVSADGYELEFIQGLNPAWIADIASHGYIVVSIIHPYGIAHVHSDGKFRPAVSLPKNDFGAHGPIWIKDQRFVLDEIESMNRDPSSFLFSRVSMNQIGVFGHSYGGATSYHTAVQDDRVKAGVDMDGTIFHSDDTNLSKPFALFVRDDTLIEHMFDGEQLFATMHDDTYLLRFKDFTHSSFGDGARLQDQWDFPDSRIGNSDLNAYRVHELLSESIRQFFDKYLKLDTATWIDETAKSPPEISVEKIH
ncbi:MAG: hypothetical protein OEZ43_20650 [Gammaproteobacteria bacterium]|nr:hypothetical protein [Gammaproteobacteria bacterium]